MKHRSAGIRLAKREALEFPLTGAEPTEELIRRRAYELYQQRGCEQGHAMEDWLRAEAEIRKQRTAPV